MRYDVIAIFDFANSCIRTIIFFKIYRNLLICNELDPPPPEKYIKPKLFLLVPLKSLSMNTP